MQSNLKEKIENGALNIAGHIFAASPNLLPETIAQIAVEISFHCINESAKFIFNEVNNIAHGE